MIQANELRLGNILYDNLYHMNIEVEDCTISEIHLGSPNYEPIPLTEEILLKCGFKKYYDKSYDVVSWEKGSFGLEETLSGYVNKSDKKIKFVHILQNAYYFDQFEELNIKL